MSAYIASGRFLNTHDQTLSKHVESFLDSRQFGGVSGIEHPPSLFLVATEFSCQLHIADAKGADPSLYRRRITGRRSGTTPRESFFARLRLNTAFPRVPSDSPDP